MSRRQTKERDYAFVVKVINSCVTSHQFNTAYKLVGAFDNKWDDFDRWDELSDYCIDKQMERIEELRCE